MANDNTPIDFNSLRLDVYDGANNNHRLVLLDGNLALPDLGGEYQHEVNMIMSQGRVIGANYGDQKVHEYAIAGHLGEFSDSAALDLIRRQGVYHPTTGTIASPGTLDATQAVRTLHILFTLQPRVPGARRRVWWGRHVLITPSFDIATPTSKISLACRQQGEFENVDNGFSTRILSEIL